MKPVQPIRGQGSFYELYNMHYFWFTGKYVHDY